MEVGIRSRLGAKTLAALTCACVLLVGHPVFAQLYIYWKGPFGTWRVGTVPVSGDGGSTGETHVSVVCEAGECRFETDCESCHAPRKGLETFTRQVSDRHLREYFPRAAMSVGATPVAYGSGFVQMVSGRMVMLDRERKPQFRLPAGARLVKDTRSGRPLMLTYPGRSEPERIR